MFVSIGTMAQEHMLGVQGGLNLTNVTGDGFYMLTGLRIGINAGLTYELHLPGNIRLGIDVLYSEQGYHSFLDYRNEYKQKLGTYKFKNHYDYLAVPIKVGYAIGEKIKVIPKIGVLTSYFLQGEIIIPAMVVDNEIQESQTLEVTDVNKVDFAGIGELGVEFKLTDYLLIEPIIAYKHSFSSIDDSYVTGVDNMRHYGYGASVAVRYRIGK